MYLINLLAEETQNTQDGNNFPLIPILFLVLIGAFFVWSILSGKKRQKEEQNKINSLKVGDKVKTIGGICGIVVEINDEENTFVLETGTDENKSFVKFDKLAIYQTAPATEETPNEETTAEEATEEIKNDAETVETTEETKTETEENK